MSTISSPTLVSNDTLQPALDAFRSDSAEWQGEVASFFDDLDRFLQTSAIVAPAASHKLESDVAGLRALVEQQTQVLTALVNTFAGDAPSPVVASPTPEDTDQVVEAFFDRVERLQQAAAEPEHST